MTAIRPWKKSRTPITTMSRPAKPTQPAQKPFDAIVPPCRISGWVPLLCQRTRTASPATCSAAGGRHLRTSPTSGSIDLVDDERGHERERPHDTHELAAGLVRLGHSAFH